MDAYSGVLSRARLWEAVRKRENACESKLLAGSLWKIAIRGRPVRTFEATLIANAVDYKRMQDRIGPSIRHSSGENETKRAKEMISFPLSIIARLHSTAESITIQLRVLSMIWVIVIIRGVLQLSRDDSTEERVTIRLSGQDRLWSSLRFWISWGSASSLISGMRGNEEMTTAPRPMAVWIPFDLSNQLLSNFDIDTLLAQWPSSSRLSSIFGCASEYDAAHPERSNLRKDEEFVEVRVEKSR